MMFENNVGNPDTFPGIEAWIMQPSHLSSSCAFNSWSQCQECSIKHRLRYFEAIVSSTACIAAEHRPLYRKHLQKYAVQFRKLIRRIVGLPPGTNWSAQWHDILHEWNMRVDHWARASGIFSWPEKCMIQYRKFACYIANLPAERLKMFCRDKALGNWEGVARNAV